MAKTRKFKFSARSEIKNVANNNNLIESGQIRRVKTRSLIDKVLRVSILSIEDRLIA